MRRSALGRGKGDGLRSDPAKARAWVDRSRRPLARGSRKRRRRLDDATIGEIARLSGYGCVVCYAPCDLRRDRHHVLPVERWPEFETVAANQVLACLNCHMNHEAALDRRIRLDHLPAETIVWALARAATEPAIYDYLLQTYPQEDARV